MQELEKDLIDNFDPLKEITLNIHRKFYEDYDNLLFSWLEPYGITRENYKEYTDRLTIVEGDPIIGGTYFVRHFYLDGSYLFSVEHTYEWKNNDIGLMKCSVRYKQYFDSRN